MGAPRRRGGIHRTSRTDRNAFVVEGIEKRTHTYGGAVGKQRPFRSRDGEHLHFAVAQQHAEGAQIVGGAVGVNDGMETALPECAWQGARKADSMTANRPRQKKY